MRIVEFSVRDPSANAPISAFSSIVPRRAGGRPSRPARGTSRVDLARSQREPAVPHGRAPTERTATGPLVSRSRRWTTPGRSVPPAALPASACTSVPCRAQRRVHDDTRPACRSTSSCSSSQAIGHGGGPSSGRLRRGSATSRLAAGELVRFRSGVRPSAPGPAAIRRCARCACRRARRGTRRAARPPCSGPTPSATARRRPPAPTAQKQPSVMAMSATLKAGQCGTLTKSVTAPRGTVDQVARGAAEQQPRRQPHERLRRWVGRRPAGRRGPRRR